jgi:capsular exopolysaccharide synthesis family protein
MSRIADALQKAGKAESVSAATPAPENAFEAFASGATAATVAAERVTARERGSSGVNMARRDPASRTLDFLRENEHCVLHPRVDVVVAQQFRKLASTLHQLQSDRTLRIVLLTSAVPGEGKTLTAANLALTLSESFRRQVLLIDADLRKPMLESFFGLQNTRGLSGILRRSSESVAPLVAITERLSLLTGGRPEGDPVGSLTSSRMRDLLLDAAETFDWVIVDTPPAALLPDAALLSSMVDGILFVLRASSTPATTVQRAIAQLTPEKIIGVILNQAEKTSLSDYGYYHRYGTKYGYEYGTVAAESPSLIDTPLV